MSATLVAGIDSSTQSCKYIVVDAATGDLVSSTAVPHPEGTSLSPQCWWDALESVGATSQGDVAAISIAAQQHTTIFLDEQNRSVRDALLWNDLRSAPQAQHLRAELTPATWIEATGALPTAAHPVSKLRWLAEVEPLRAEQVERVVIPHDWLTWKLLGGHGEFTTDRSDASGTGYWSPVTESYRTEIMVHAFGREITPSRVLGPAERAGITASGMVVAAGCGDNAAAMLALDGAPGEAVISVGTSLTVAMSVAQPVSDATGHVASMADASGTHMPIVATLNGARTLTSVARMLGVGVNELDDLAQKADPAAHGLAFLPYLDGERTPFLPAARGVLFGLTRESMNPNDLARVAILGVACAIATAIDDLVGANAMPSALTIIGGGARSESLRQAVADLTGLQVNWPKRSEYAALGAARQAAWALTGELPQWRQRRPVVITPAETTTWVAEVRERHRRAMISLRDGRELP